MQVETPRYFEWSRYRSAPPVELSALEKADHPIAIVGAGPVGLTLALTIAQYGIPVVLLEARDTLSDNSRTLAVTRRSVQILDRLGIAQAFREKAITRESNYVYHGRRLVSQAPYGQDPQEKYPDISVLQQPWTEKVLLDAVIESPYIDIRWLNAVTGINTSDPLRPELEVEAPEGVYSLAARYVIAADGARGQVRRSLGLKYEEIGDGVISRNFVICDFELRSDLPIARRLWICPPYRPNSAVILHRQPFDVWRLDYALDDDEDIEKAMSPDVVAGRVKEQLSLLGLSQDEFRLVWISSYRPMSRSLPCYRAGNVLFAGDAAHQTPIFGGRGMNQGLLDAANLGWKLALVLKGEAPEKLLDTYDAERRPLIVQNLHDIGLATLCMTAPTKGAALMRKAAFDLLPTEPFILPLIDAFNASKSECLDPAHKDMPTHPAVVGNPLPDCIVQIEGKSAFLHDLLCPASFTGLFFCVDDPGASIPATAEKTGARHRTYTEAVVHLRPHDRAKIVLADDAARARLEVEDGDWMLIRPDGYIQSRITRPSAQEIQHEYLRAIGCQVEIER